MSENFGLTGMSNDDSLERHVRSQAIADFKRNTYGILASDILRTARMQAIIETRIGNFVLSMKEPYDPTIIAQAAEVFKLKIDELTKE